TAACAKLMKLPAAAVADAIGIAASLASGLSANFGTMTKPLHAGQAARNAIMAARLAASGFTPPRPAPAGGAGHFRRFARDLDVSLAPFDDLGTSLDIVTHGFTLKPYASGGLGHAAIEAAVTLRDRLGGRTDAIATVTVGTTQHALDHISSDYPTT